MALRKKILLNCETATALVEKKRDQKLELSERFGLWIHLAYCSFCALFFQQSKIIDDSAKAYGEKITNEQKAYKLDPLRKAALTEAFDKEIKNQTS
jgi:predicted AAA+ superfamily ATPase